MSRQVTSHLIIEPPMALCGNCNFQTALAGKFSVENGRLVWRADADIQPRRGPDLTGCVEGYDVAKFAHVEVVQSSGGWEYERLSDPDFDALKNSAQN